MIGHPNPPTSLTQEPPSGKTQGNAGGLHGAGEATSFPAPLGGSYASWQSAQSTSGSPPVVGPQNPSRPIGQGEGVQGFGDSVPDGYLESLAKDAPDEPPTPDSSWFIRASQQLSFQDQCPGWATIGQCEEGHAWVKELVCGKEWCPTCGQKDSVAHNRRFARWLKKGRQLHSMGYLVITIPMKHRNQFLSKNHIRYAYDACIKILAGARTSRHSRVGGYFPRGLGRWHWFGEKSDAFNPHLNFLVDGGYLSDKKLAKLRTDLQTILHLPNIVIHYEYSTEVGKKLHWLKYVTRATFLDYDLAPDFADITLFNFRNARYWGKWDSEPQWEDSENLDLKGAEVEALENSECPKCGKHVEWSKPLRRSAVMGQVGQVACGAGYYGIANHHDHDHPPPRLAIPPLN